MVAHLQGRFAPADRSYLLGVAAVPPAHLLELSVAGLSCRRYWDLAPSASLRFRRRRLPPRSGKLLHDVVEDTMPAAASSLTLSSGLDTATLALFWRRAYPEAELDAILWTTPELASAEEYPAANEMAGMLRLRAHSVRADRHWPLSATGEPLGGPDSPSVPFYAEVWEETFRRARRIGATSLITGTGGDHLFGYGGLGAYTYVDLLLTGRWLELASQVRRHLGVSPASLARILDRDLLRPIAHLLLPSWRPPSRRAVPWLGPAARQELRYVERRRSGRPGAGLPARRHRLSVLSDPGIAGLLSDLGERGRRHGIEVRHPFLDHRLVELATRLPGEACFRAGYYKVVLRDLLRGHVPAEVVERRDKVTPEAIFDRGVRERQAAQVQDLLRGMQAARRGWVDEGTLRRAYASYQRDGRGGSRIWFALTLEHWLRRYF